MSTKTTKRKRTSAAAIETTAPTTVVESVAVAPSTPTIGLSSNSTVKDAAALKGILVGLLDEPSSVAIDAKSVERIDTAIMQLLCAFVRDRAARNLAVTWSATPQALLDAARLLGIGSLLALPANS
jgi:ABC-type transporter Mla MlaB component